MARSIPPDRFGRLIEVATRTFIAEGYRRTQMADVAEALGVAKGTLYGYVESKEALFDAVVRHADGHTALPDASALPLPSPPAGATVAYVRERLAAEAEGLVLARVVSGELVISGAARELEAVLSDLFKRVARNRLSLKVVDRCATDYPELAEVWFNEGRWAQQRLLVDWLVSRVATKKLRPANAPEATARTILETVAFWAMHRHFDRSPQPISDEDALSAVVDLVAHGLLPDR